MLCAHHHPSWPRHFRGATTTPGGARTHTRTHARGGAHSDDLPGPSVRPINVSLDMGRPILSSPAPVLTSVERSRLDTRPETELYSPVMVHHTDDVFRRRLRDLYRQVLPPGARVLDLCSSFASHLPPADDLCLGPVTGLGLNEAEMTANKRLDAFVTHDLNAQPRLPFGDGSFDAVLWCCGIQYLQYPEVISAEASRVLSPGGSVLVSFSTHCYAEKAIAGWLERDDAARLMLVTDFLRGAGFGGVHAWGRLPRAQARSAFASGGGRDAGAGAGADAFYAVAATRPAAATVSAPSPSSAGAGARGGGGAREQERDPASLAARYVAPALREIELLGGEEAGPGTDEAATAVASGTGGSDSGGVVARGDGPSGLLQQPVPSAAWREGSGGDAVDAGVRPETLERWEAAYREMAAEASSLGIPVSCIPQLPRGAGAAQIREARDHLQAMIGSFLSSGL